MNTDQMEQMSEYQLEHVKKKIIQTYGFLISKTGLDPQVVELIKLAP